VLRIVLPIVAASGSISINVVDIVLRIGVANEIIIIIYYYIIVTGPTPPTSPAPASAPGCSNR
jgi:hypothetical protein